MPDGTRKDTYEEEKTKLEEKCIDYDLDDLYYKVVGGRKKGVVYGLGSAAELFYQPTRGCASYTQGIMAELTKSKRAQEEAEARFAREEEVKRKFREDTLKTQEEMRQQLSLLQQQCNLSRSFGDPQDPFGDGGSTSEAAFMASS